jgi:hypothetical protein
MADTTHGKDPELPSERSFGLMFGAIGLAFAALFAWRDRPVAWIAAAAVAGVVFLAIALLAPKLLAPLNRAWFRFGLLLAKVVNPIVLGVIFFLVISPYALFLRVIGRDSLRLRPTAGATSYWIERDPANSPAGAFDRQY